jgi:hypothetical protein
MQQTESKKLSQTKTSSEKRKTVKICKVRIGSMGGGREGRKKIFFEKVFGLQIKKKIFFGSFFEKVLLFEKFNFFVLKTFT